MSADHGGPLLNGDIEEMGGKVTIKCPWHAYQIALASGEGLYMGVDMVRNSAGKIESTPPRIKSKGRIQRTHEVKERDGDIYVADTSKLGAYCSRSCLSCCSRVGSASWRLTARVSRMVAGDLLKSDVYAFRHVDIPEPKEGEVRIHSKFSS